MSNGGSPAKNIFFARDNSIPTGNSFVDGLTSQVNDDTMNKIIDTQRECLWKFEKANEMMSNCAQLCDKRLVKVQKDAAAHNQLILQMKTDMDFIFTKIRRFKKGLSIEYPEIYQAAESEHRQPQTEDDG